MSSAKRGVQLKIGGYLLDIGTLHHYNAAQGSWPGLQQ
jgi:hypothetical protein